MTPPLRQDLLALSPDDLAVLSNRGNVKRAMREVEAGTPAGILETDASGAVCVRWEDAARCELPADEKLAPAHCDCPAEKICRHLVRTVLLYQQHCRRAAASPETGPGTSSPDSSGPAPSGPSFSDPGFSDPGSAPAAVDHPPPGTTWDPGQIEDALLARHFKKAALTAAKKSFDAGLYVEMVRSAKPLAQFHILGHALRFLVPGDLRYTHCDCDQEAPCSHVPLAIWAFRRLPADQLHGVISTQAEPLPVDPEVLARLDAAGRDLLAAGIVDAQPSLRGTLTWARDSALAAHLPWPALVLHDMLEEVRLYQDRDGRFHPQRLARLLGELALRTRGIRNEIPHVARFQICGTPRDQTSAIGVTRFVGLGCGAALRQTEEATFVHLTAYLQDIDAGGLVVVQRDLRTPENEPADAPLSLTQLANRSTLRNHPLTAWGGGNVVVAGATRSAARVLLPGRKRMTVSPQDFAWEKLRAPVRRETFAEAFTLLDAAPPRALRPRRVTEDFHVLPCHAVVDVEFDSGAQMLKARLADAAGGEAWLLHPFTSRGQPGFDATLHGLDRAMRNETRLRFAAGHLQRRRDRLELRPTGLVFEAEGKRQFVQPWFSPAPDGASPRGRTQGDRDGAPPPPATPLAELLEQLLAAIGESILHGLQRPPDHLERQWNRAQAACAQLGTLRLHRLVGDVVAALEARRTDLRGDREVLITAVRELALVVELALEIGGPD